jgi:hypothetical protein
MAIKISRGEYDRGEWSVSPIAQRVAAERRAISEDPELGVPEPDPREVARSGSVWTTIRHLLFGERTQA